MEHVAPLNSWGNVPLNSVIPFWFDSFDGGTGASITLTGLALGDILCYKGTSMTQRSSTAGIVLLDTDGIDLDTITGIHGFSIDTSDNTDAGFYAAGSFYTVVVASVTIDAQTVNFVAGTFRLTAAEGVAGVADVNVTHVGDTAQTAGDIMADTNDIQTRLPAALVGGRMDASVGAMAANVVTAAAVADGAIDAATFAAGAIDAAAMNVTGSEFTAIPWNAAWDAEVQSEVEDALDVTIADSVPADGTRPSVRQALYMIAQMLTDFGIVGTTLTCYKPDGVTALFTCTLNDGTSPTALTRAT